MPEGRRKVILNLMTALCRRTGIGKIAGAYTLAPCRRKSELVGVSPRIQELLKTTNLDTIVGSFPDEPAVLEALGTTP